MLVFSPLSFIANEVENLIARGYSIHEAGIFNLRKERFKKKKPRKEET